MKFQSYRRQIFLFTIGIFIVGILGTIAYDQWTNRIQIKNLSQAHIKQAVIRVGNNTYEVTDIEPGASRSILFQVESDSHFQCRFLSHTGEVIETEFGYMPGGAGRYGNKAQVRIYPDKLVAEMMD
ncbi:MAG: hypothetical protein LR011_10415 [Verrucomicrobia bacterium]|nr:hypothetical protein [Verrucomicrobiota bacterium]